MSLNLLDYLRLEVQGDPTGLGNLLENTTGERGPWGWLVGQGIAFDGVQVAGLGWRFTVQGNGGPLLIAGPPCPVTPGQYVAMSWLQDNNAGTVTGNERYSVSGAFYDASGAVVGTITATSLLSTNTLRRQIPAALVPAGAVTVRYFINFYGNASSGNLPSNVSMRFGELTIAQAATSTALASLPYITEPAYVDILGDSNQIRVSREPLGATALTATILNPTLDPAVSTALRPGRKIRLTAHTPAGTWEPLFTGRITDPSTSYDALGRRPSRITLVAAGVSADLAKTPRSASVVNVADLPVIFNGVPVPWRIVSQTGFTDTPPLYGPIGGGGSLIDQITTTTNGNLAYAWIDATGLFRVSLT